MTKIKTKSGFCTEIDEKALDDAELLDLLVELDEENFTVFPTVLKKILGADGKKKLYDHLRNEDGRVPYESLTAEINDIMAGLKSKKK